jgi:hypothetical protein
MWWTVKFSQLNVALVATMSKQPNQPIMKCCQDCLAANNQITDYDIKELHKTKQGYKCERHYRSWVERRRYKIRSTLQRQAM